MVSRSVVGGKGHALPNAVGAQYPGKVGPGSSPTVSGGTDGSLSSWGFLSGRSSSSISSGSSKNGGGVSDKASGGIADSVAATSNGRFVTFGQPQHQGAVKKKPVLLPLRVVGLHFRGREASVGNNSSNSRTGFSWGGGQNPSLTKPAPQSVSPRAGGTHEDSADTPSVPANTRLELEREPYNVYDPNAIKVTRKTATERIIRFVYLKPLLQHRTLSARLFTSLLDAHLAAAV